MFVLRHATRVRVGAIVVTTALSGLVVGAAQASPTPPPKVETPKVAPRAADPEPAVPEEDAVVRQGAESPAGGTVRLAPSAKSESDAVGALIAVGGSDVVPDRSMSTIAAVADRTTDRLAGSNRYLTNVAVSQRTHPEGTKDVLLASGENFPDGLAASAVGVALDAPLILTKKSSLPAPSATELSRLAPSRVIVAGGAGAVSDGVVASVRRLLPAGAAPPTRRTSKPRSTDELGFVSAA